MADFVAVLRKTIDGLGDKPTPEMRARVYEKARATIGAKLAAINPPPPAAVAERQRRSLEDAIAQVESEYTPARPMRDRSDPLAELEQVFASLQSRPEIKPTPLPTPVPPASSWTSSLTRPAPAPAEPARSPLPSYAPAARTEPVAAPPRDVPLPPKPAARLPETPAPVISAASHDDDGAISNPERETPAYGPEDEPYDAPSRGRGLVVPIAAAVAALVLVGGGYAMWVNKDDFAAMLGFGETEVAATPPQQAEPAPAQEETAPAAQTAAPAAEPEPAEAKPADAAASGEAAPQKFTQRLNADGSEVDEGPAGGAAPAVGEGTTVAAATQAPQGSSPISAQQPAAGDGAADGQAQATDGQAQATAQQPPAAAVAVGQKAIFYEERTSSAQGSAEGGSIVWSLVRESPGGDAPPEPAIRGEATIPAKDLQLRLTIRRNADRTLPASHIIELIFLTPEGFGGGGIDNILRFVLKDTEEAPGNPLIGIPAKIADGYFLIALNDSKAEMDANLQLLGRQNWIDIPVVYKSGRRALITMEKGIPGEKAFEEAMKAWQAATAG